MNDEKLKKGIGEINKIVMTSGEKKHIFDNIINSKNKIGLVKSPWSFSMFIILAKRNKFAYYIIIPLIIILSSGGLAFASEKSLPNSLLYPIKVKIVEPIEGALIFSLQARAMHQSNLATKRLVEVETLAKQGNFNDKEEKKINKLLESHTISLGKAIDEIDKSVSDKNRTEDKNKKENISEIITNFSQEMNSHAQVLEDIIKKEDFKEEFQIRNKRISDKARENADHIKYDFENKDIEEKKTEKEEKSKNKEEEKDFFNKDSNKEN